MKIGIDCRMAGIGEGIARYVEELIKHLGLIDKTNQYFLICSSKLSTSSFVLPNNFQFVVSNINYYSWNEQIKFLFVLMRLKLDLVHFPNFNMPIFYPGEFIITIHDLIHHRYPGKKKFRYIHRLAYRLVIDCAVNRAAKIIAVSRATKTTLIDTFKIPESKVTAIYEGVNERFYVRHQNSQIASVLAKYGIDKPYLLFIGVWRQYKNLPLLSAAFDIIKKTHDIQLVLVGKIDQFYPEIKQEVFANPSFFDIKALGHIEERDLPTLYQGAVVFVLPSLLEGFGLIGLEAQASGVPVAASNIAVLREILGEGAIFFDPVNKVDMAEKIKKILENRDLAQSLIEAGNTNVKKYNWQKTARETLDVYENFSRRRG